MAGVGAGAQWVDKFELDFKGPKPRAASHPHIEGWDAKSERPKSAPLPYRAGRRCYTGTWPGGPVKLPQKNCDGIRLTLPKKPFSIDA